MCPPARLHCAGSWVVREVTWGSRGEPWASKASALDAAWLGISQTRALAQGLRGEVSPPPSYCTRLKEDNEVELIKQISGVE